jgi:WD40 repeat protein
MVNKLVLFALFLLFSVGTNLHLLSQEPIDLEILWQKEVFPKEIKFAQFSADGQWIYAATGSGIEKISAETGEFVSSFSTDAIYNFELSQKGDFIITTNGEDKATIWKVIEQIRFMDLNFKTENNEFVQTATISPDEKYAICGTLIAGINNANSKLVIMDIFKNAIFKTLLFPGKITTIKFSHDGKYFATGGWYEDLDGKQYDEVILWSTETWDPVKTIENLEGNGSGYKCIKFSRDNQYLGLVRLDPSDGRVYNITNKQIISTSSAGEMCYNIEFLIDNYIIYSNGGSYIELKDFNNLIKKFQFYSSNLTSFSGNNLLKIFGCAGTWPMAMLCNKPIGVETEHTKLENIIISYDKNDLIIQTENILDNLLQIEISDLKGKVVLSEILQNNILNNKILFPVNLNSGVYICKITAGDKTYTHKFQIVR